MNCWRCGGIITDDVPALRGDGMVYPTMPPKFSHAVCPEGGVYKATRLPASSVDSDSKLDLDDVAAGHPVAMYELQELRAQRDAAHNDARLLDGQIAELRGLCEKLKGFIRRNPYAPYGLSYDEAVAWDNERAALIDGPTTLLPAPGVAAKSGEGREAR